MHSLERLTGSVGAPPEFQSAGPGERFDDGRGLRRHAVLGVQGNVVKPAEVLLVEVAGNNVGMKNTKKKRNSQHTFPPSRTYPCYRPSHH